MKFSIRWNELGCANSILEAEKEVRQTGNDVGWEKIHSFIPRDDNHHHWMSFSALLTVIYNRDHEPQRFSIFRIVTSDILHQTDRTKVPYFSLFQRVNKFGGGGRLGNKLFLHLTIIVHK